MDSLTDEQRRRMEENRQKALAKRAATVTSVSQAQYSAPATGTISKSMNAPAPSTTPKPNVPVPTSSKNLAENPYAPKATSVVAGNNFKEKFPVGSSYQPKSQPVNQQSKQLTSSSYSLVVSGSCVLVSRDRFTVNIGYHPQLIALFKTISGNMYEPESRKWSFPFSEHGNLMAAVNSLKPNVVVGGLPTFILKIFRNSPTEADSDTDLNTLSRIDQQLVTSLFPFQREGVCFAVRKNGRCLIADDMGLGKTIQALGVAHYYYNEWPLLITTASSMRFAWREAIWKWLPTVPAGSITVVATCKDMIQCSKVIILTYDLLHRRHQELQHCNVVIMDESHNLKNFKTARSKAAIPILQKAKRAILLTGTPALSRPIELFTQISAISKSTFSSLEDFGIRYCDGKKNQWGWDYSGSSNMEELNLLLRETVMIRRLKSDVLTQLPPKRRKAIPLDLGLVREKNKGLQIIKTAFDKARMVKGTRASDQRTMLLQYFSETGKTKVDAVVSYVKDLIEQDKKFLCFGHHQDMLDGISTALESMKVKYIRIDGSTASDERHYLCDQFQFRDDVKVAVLSILAANSGITLTAAHLVVFAELFWNPGILTQAEDRAHRIGQEDSVLIEYLVAPGTCDDYMWPLISDKLDILNKAGLSKDNFREADVEILKKKKTDQREINDFFKPSPPLPSTMELEDLFSDEFEDELLLSAQKTEVSVLPTTQNWHLPVKKTKY